MLRPPVRQARPLAVAVLALLGASGAASFAGCRDYDRFADIDLTSPPVDAGVIDSASRDSATPSCPPIDVDAAIAIGTEQQTGLPTTSGQVVRTVRGHFRGNTVDVAAVALGPPSSNATPTPATVTLLEPRIDGTFAVVGTPAALPHGATAVDVFSLDGKDLLVASYDCGFQRTGCGISAAQWDAGANSFVEIGSASTSYPPVLMQRGDVDRNGVEDLVVAQISNTAAAPPYGTALLTIYFGGTQFPSAPSYMNVTTTIALPSALAIADFDGDLMTDIAVYGTNASGTPHMLAILKRGGDQLFAEVQGTDVVSPNPLPVNEVATMLAADIDGNGMPALLLGDSADGPAPAAITVLRSTGAPVSPMFTSALIATSGRVHGLRAIDWNEDGALDLFAWIQPPSSTGEVLPTLLQNLGKGAFAERPSPAFARPEQFLKLSVTSPEVLDVPGACGKRLVFADGITPAPGGGAIVSTFTR